MEISCVMQLFCRTITFVKRVSFDAMPCSIAQTLEVVGEWWTLLIVRDVSLGLRRFEEIQDDLGISRNILTDRLNKLVDDEILYRTNIATTGTRYDYRLTDKGRDLLPGAAGAHAVGRPVGRPSRRSVHRDGAHHLRPRHRAGAHVLALR